jgi:hypothetical protein
MYFGFVSILKTSLCVHRLPLNSIPLEFRSRAIAVQPCRPSITIENMWRTHLISFRGPGTSIIRSVVRLLHSPRLNFCFGLPSEETINPRKPYPGGPPTQNPICANRLLPRKTFSPSSRLNSAAMLLFSAFRIELEGVSSFANCSAQCSPFGTVTSTLMSPSGAHHGGNSGSPATPISRHACRNLGAGLISTVRITSQLPLYLC